MGKSFSLTGLPSDLLTDDREYIRRIAVDPQQTSFEKNFQFVTNEATSGHTEIIWEQR